MYALRPGRRGLGYVGTCPTGQVWNTSANVCVAPGEAVAAPQSDIVNQTPQAISNCSGSGWAYAFDPLCWGYSLSAWNQMAAYQASNLNTPPVAPAAIPAAYTATAPTVEEAQQQTTAALNAAAAQTQQNNLAASQNQPTVCDSGEVLADDGVTCYTPSSTNWALWGALALVGVFGAVALSGGSPRRYGR